MADGERRAIGPFDVEFIPVTHSVPHAFAIAVHTPQGVILHSGDFKLDLTPVDDRRTDLARIGALAASEGIRLLMADSTNAEEPGYAPSERKVGAVLRALFADQPGRRIITVQLRQPHPPHPADRRRRHRLRPRGRHARPVDEEERPPGPRPRRCSTIPDASLVDIEEVDELAPAKVCVISTGSQGEPMSALACWPRARTAG